jgi:hypothetical protein
VVCRGIVGEATDTTVFLVARKKSDLPVRTNSFRRLSSPLGGHGVWRFREAHD